MFRDVLERKPQLPVIAGSRGDERSDRQDDTDKDYRNNQ
jgi:hypothetical protein